MKKKTFRILDFKKPTPTSRGQAEAAHFNRIKKMERECDEMFKRRAERNE